VGGHVRGGQDRQPERALQVHGQRLVEQFLAHRVEAVVQRRHAGVVDEHVQPAGPRERLGDEPVAVAPPAHVTGDGHRLAPGRGLDLLGRGLARVKLAGGDDHVGARLGQRLDDGPADSARSPGDDGHLAGHVVQRREGSHEPIVS
jgi:hypothetical protein